MSREHWTEHRGLGMELLTAERPRFVLATRKEA